MKPFKTYTSTLLIALFIVSTFAMIPVNASTGHANLGTYTTLTTGGVYTQAVTNVGVRAGSNVVYSVDGVPLGGTNYFAIEFTGVTFSGSQFSLYMSLDGLSQISAGDTPYTVGFFDLSELNTVLVATHQFTGPLWANGTSPTFYIFKSAASNYLVLAPAPFNMAGGNYYIKVYDGSTTALAVSSQTLTLEPNIAVVPSTPIPAGYTVTVTGAAWPSNGLVNISVSDPAGIAVSADVTPSANGAFTWTFMEPDEGLRSGTNTIPNWPWATLVTAFNTTGVQPQVASRADLSVTATVNYQGRAFYNFISIDNSGAAVASTVFNTPYPGDNSFAINGKVLGTMYVNGTYFNPSGNVTAFADWGLAGQVALPLTFISALSAKGMFNASFQVPVLSLGPHKISFVDASWSWNFTLTILTTLIISPTKGPQGTSVTATGYGFTASVPFTLYFFGTNAATFDADTQAILEGSGNTTAAGSFSVTFTIPSNVYGGSHDVGVNTTAPDYAFTTFTVQPTFALDTSAGPLGTVFNMIGTGVPAGSGTYTHSLANVQFTAITDAHATGATSVWYIPAYDNAISPVETGFSVGLRGNNTGYAKYPFVAAGVPMVHYAEIISAVSGGPYTIVAALPFTVNGSTQEGAAILSQLATNTVTLSSLQTTLTSLNTAVSGLTTTTAAIQSSLGSLTTTVNAIQTSVGANLASSVASLTTSVGSLSTSVSGITSSLGSLSTAVTSGFSGVNTAITGAQSALGTKIDKVDTDVTTVGSSVTALSGTVGTMSTSVNSIKTDVGTINTATGNIGTVTTILYIAVILAAIAVVLEVLILIRKK
jgi:uncharacterized protein YoxC